MSGLLKHKRKHLSVSQCHTFKKSPWRYLYQNIMGNFDPAGPAAFRGTAAEAGVTMGLLNLDAPIADCQAHAVQEFDRLCLLATGDKIDKEREAIPGLVQNALDELRPYGKPSHVQHTIWWQSPELPIPFKGIIDFMWEDHGIIVDLKTKAQMPSKIEKDHARQLALYGAAVSDNYGLRVCYATHKRHAVYEVENAKLHLGSLVAIAKTIDRFLDLADDPATLLACVAPDTDAFEFSETLKQRAYEISGV